MSNRRILAIFDQPTGAAQAIAAVRHGDLGQIVAYSPVPHQAIAKVLQPDVSPVRIFILIGGILGCISGFALPIYTALDWPLITGGKPLISIPPITVIAFELTILLAAVAGVVGFLILAGLPRLREQCPYDARVTEDHYGVLVTCAEEHVEAVRALLESSGAGEVRHENA